MKRQGLRWISAAILIAQFSGCALLPRGQESPDPKTFSPLSNRVALCVIPKLDSTRIPRDRVESLFQARLGQIFETVNVLSPELSSTGEVQRRDPVQAAVNTFLEHQDLSASDVSTLTAKVGAEFLGVFTLTDFGQDFANLKKVTRVGVSLVLYHTDQLSEMSRRSVLVEEQDSLSGRTYEAAAEKAVRLLLMQMADDLRKHYRTTSGFERVPDPKIHPAEQGKPPSDITEWWQQRRKKAQE